MHHAIAAAVPAFLASLVEFVEALTIVLAVGVTRGWRPALLGTAAAVAFLGALVLAFGPLLGRVPIGVLQLTVGALLLLFGMRWLHKAVLRYAGVVALHDEASIYERECASLAGGGDAAGWDVPALSTAFNAVALEGLEVVFIVIALGATGGQLLPASIGAALAGVVVVGAGVVVHRPLARVPENTLKFAVGVMLSTFGTFWTGEGLGVAWPGDDLSLAWLVAGFTVASAVAVMLARRARPAAA